MSWQPPVPPPQLPPPGYPPPFQPPRRPAAVEAAFVLLLVRAMLFTGLMKLRIDAIDEANRARGFASRIETEILSALFPLGVLALFVMWAVKIRRGSGATAIGMSVVFGTFAVDEIAGLVNAATPTALVLGLLGILLTAALITVLWLPASRAYFEGMRPFRSKRPPPPPPPPGWSPPPPGWQQQGPPPAPPQQGWGPPPG